MDDPDLALQKRDNDFDARFDTYCPVVRVAPLTLLSSKNLSWLRAYWRDVHGPDLAGMPGLLRYYQHHLAPARGSDWPSPPGISVDIDPAHQLGGLAELGYADLDGQEAFDRAVDSSGSKDDDRTFLARGTVQASLPGNHRTYKNELADLVPNGEVPGFGVIVALRCREDLDRAGFVEDVRAYAEGLAARERTLKVRMIACEDNVQADWDAADVIHPGVPEQYQAFIEVRFKSRLHAAITYEEPEFQDLQMLLAPSLAAFHVFPIEASYCMVLQGQRTLAGMYGADSAETILRVGAPLRWNTSVPI